MTCNMFVTGSAVIANLLVIAAYVSEPVPFK